jgi:ATP-binding cassette subfamily F protein 2
LLEEKPFLSLSFLCFFSIDLSISLCAPASAMVSDASKKKAAQKKAAAAAKRGDKAKAAITLSERTCTAVLTSHPLSRDIHIESLSLTFHGHDLLLDTDLELNYGR